MDAAIVDVETDDQTLLSVSIILVNASVPFVFSSRAKSNVGTYSMSGDSAELRATWNVIHASLIIDRGCRLFRGLFVVRGRRHAKIS